MNIVQLGTTWEADEKKNTVLARAGGLVDPSRLRFASLRHIHTREIETRGAPVASDNRQIQIGRKEYTHEFQNREQAC